MRMFASQTGRQSTQPPAPSSRTVLSIGLAVAFFLLLPRLGFPDSLGKYLWAEDATIFIEQARHLGIASLWTPYAGYLHIYQRISAWLANTMPLRDQAIFFFCSWLVAYGILIATVIRQALALNVRPLYIVLLIFLISGQPNGEVFFSLTNVQWLLGTALTLYVINDRTERPHPADFLVIALLGLTGPFSLLMAPFVLLRFIRRKMTMSTKALFLLLLVTAAIQCAFLLGSPRIQTGSAVSAPGIVPTILTVVSDLIRVALFKENPFVRGLGLLFWILLGGSIFIGFKDMSLRSSRNFHTALLFLVVALYQLVVTLVLLSRTGWPLSIASSRYTWLPYSLIFFSAILLLPNLGRAGFLLVAGPIVLCIAQMHPLYRKELQFSSYVDLARSVTVDIPINPSGGFLVPNAPAGTLEDTWHISSTQRDKTDNAVSRYEMDLTRFVSSDSSLSLENKILNIDSTKENSYIQSIDSIKCKDSKDVGLIVQFTQDSKGIITLSWSTDDQYVEDDSLSRFYPSGEGNMEFAFPNSAAHRSIRLSFPDRIPHIEIQSVSIYCLGHRGF
jgi:hypothetical protein